MVSIRIIIDRFRAMSRTQAIKGFFPSMRPRMKSLQGLVREASAAGASFMNGVEEGCDQVRRGMTETVQMPSAR